MKSAKPIRIFLGLLFLVAFPTGQSQLLGQTIGDLNVFEKDGKGLFSRIHGPGGEGRQGDLGLPVAGGFDMNGDGLPDTAVAYFLASPMGRSVAGEVYLVFGDGELGQLIDAAQPQTRILRIIGDGNREATGSEIWMDDVTGDGLGDLLICRQNLFFKGRLGAGGLTLIIGHPELAQMALRHEVLDLRSPPPAISVVTLGGASAGDRLGIWARTGDLDGDGTADVVVGADQAGDQGSTHHGALYALRGGGHLAASQSIDLADFPTTALPGQLARIVPPAGTAELHFGSTCQVADLNANGRAEVLVASDALNRSGAILGPTATTSHGASQAAGSGEAFIVWDDMFPAAPWPTGLQIDLSTSGPAVSRVRGGAANRSFGEELIGGLDFDGDQTAEFFVGDLTGDGSPAGNRPSSGVGYVIFNAQSIKGLDFSIDQPPSGLRISTILGPNSSAIASDTVAQGDFNGDGMSDLMIGAPHASPQGRANAGAMYVLLGRPQGWPALIDTATGFLPDPAAIRIIEIQGAHGRFGADEGDTLCYSAAAGDLNGDGLDDLIVNEMVGNGLLPGAQDVGNLILLSGRLFALDDTPYPPARPLRPAGSPQRSFPNR